MSSCSTAFWIPDVMQVKSKEPTAHACRSWGPFVATTGCFCTTLIATELKTQNSRSASERWTKYHIILQHKLHWVLSVVHFSAVQISIPQWVSTAATWMASTLDSIAFASQFLSLLGFLGTCVVLFRYLDPWNEYLILANLVVRTRKVWDRYERRGLLPRDDPKFFLKNIER